ncbi:MAG: hypothetical protein EPN20_12455 [Magnetospirillum sp.]|nr:MAG: hypothetical protein EPN20_12455 [Magnetospirillum sp.]
MGDPPAGPHPPSRRHPSGRRSAVGAPYRLDQSGHAAGASPRLRRLGGPRHERQVHLRHLRQAHAWNKLVDQPWVIMSIGLRKWAHGF